MGKRYRKLYIVSAIVIFAALVVWDALQHRGPSGLDGGFEEIAFVRNGQNKGGIVRIYAFSVTDTAGADYLGCGELLPHNDYGSITKAFFFEAGKAMPHEIQLDPPHFDTLQFRPVAVYTKGEDGVGNVARVGLSR